jgi:hypothetical protein
MPISAPLAAALASLTEALDEPGSDIAATVEQLGADARVAVHSYLGLTISVPTDGDPVSFTALTGPGPAEPMPTSLRMGLPPGADPGAADGSTMSLILYAGIPGAFVDLAADLSWLTGTSSDAFVLDQDLTLPTDTIGAYGLTTRSIINQAVGVLLGSGYDIEQAHQHIDRLAADAGTDRRTAAAGVLAAAEERQLPWRS